jgi:hypothetical protein
MDPRKKNFICGNLGKNMIKKTFQLIEERLGITLPSNGSRVGRITGVSKAVNASVPSEEVMVVSHHKDPRNLKRYVRLDEEKLGSAGRAIDKSRQAFVKPKKPVSLKSSNREEVVESEEEEGDEGESDERGSEGE